MHSKPNVSISIDQHGKPQQTFTNSRAPSEHPIELELKGPPLAAAVSKDNKADTPPQKQVDHQRLWVHRDFDFGSYDPTKHEVCGYDPATYNLSWNRYALLVASNLSASFVAVSDLLAAYIVGYMASALLSGVFLVSDILPKAMIRGYSDPMGNRHPMITRYTCFGGDRVVLDILATILAGFAGLMNVALRIFATTHLEMNDNHAKFFAPFATLAIATLISFPGSTATLLAKGCRRCSGNVNSLFHSRAAVRGVAGSLERSVPVPMDAQEEPDYMKLSG